MDQSISESSRIASPDSIQDTSFTSASEYEDCVSPIKSVAGEEGDSGEYSERNLSAVSSTSTFVTTAESPSCGDNILISTPQPEKNAFKDDVEEHTLQRINCSRGNLNDTMDVLSDCMSGLKIDSTLESSALESEITAELIEGSPVVLRRPSHTSSSVPCQKAVENFPCILLEPELIPKTAALNKDQALMVELAADMEDLSVQVDNTENHHGITENPPFASPLKPNVSVENLSDEPSKPEFASPANQFSTDSIRKDTKELNGAPARSPFSTRRQNNTEKTPETLHKQLGSPGSKENVNPDFSTYQESPLWNPAIIQNALVELNSSSVERILREKRVSLSALNSTFDKDDGVLDEFGAPTGLIEPGPASEFDLAIEDLLNHSARNLSDFEKEQDLFDILESESATVAQNITASADMFAVALECPSEDMAVSSDPVTSDLNNANYPKVSDAQNSAQDAPVPDALLINHVSPSLCPTNDSVARTGSPNNTLSNLPSPLTKDKAPNTSTVLITKEENLNGNGGGSPVTSYSDFMSMVASPVKSQGSTRLSGVGTPSDKGSVYILGNVNTPQCGGFGQQSGDTSSASAGTGYNLSTEGMDCSSDDQVLPMTSQLLENAHAQSNMETHSPARDDEFTGFDKLSPQNFSQPMDSGFSASTEDAFLAPTDDDFHPSSTEEFQSPQNEVFGEEDFVQLGNFGADSKCPSRLARESLYVRFDPLVGGLSPVKSAGVSSTGFNFAKPKVPEPKMNQTLQDTRLIDLDASTFIQEPKVEAEPQPNTITEEEMKRILAEHLQKQELLFNQQRLQESKAHMDEVNGLKRDKNRLSKTLTELKGVVSEYKVSMEQMAIKFEQDGRKVRVNEVALARDLKECLSQKEDLECDLSRVEGHFTDLVKRYEKQKKSLEFLKQNESTMQDYMKRANQERVNAVQKLEAMTIQMTDCERTRDEFQASLNKMEGELASSNAQLKKAELKFASLELNLQQKTKENADLTQLCEELIGKLGNKS